MYRRCGYSGFSHRTSRRLARDIDARCRWSRVADGRFPARRQLAVSRRERSYNFFEAEPVGESNSPASVSLMVRRILVRAKHTCFSRFAATVQAIDQRPGALSVAHQ